MRVVTICVYCQIIDRMRGNPTLYPERMLMN
jgi:hypothetical protein